MQKNDEYPACDDELYFDTRFSAERFVIVFSIYFLSTFDLPVFRSSNFLYCAILKVQTVGCQTLLLKQLEVKIRSLVHHVNGQLSSISTIIVHFTKHETVPQPACVVPLSKR